MDEVRRAYDDGAARYVAGIGTTIGPATETAADRAVLARFGEEVRAIGLVADVGCGPARAAAFLASRGVTVVGVDLSIELLRAGRAAHPAIGTSQGELAGLPLRSSWLGGAVAWYSIIHTAPAGLPAVCAELARVVERGGTVLLAFQAGTGDPVAGRTTTTYWHDPDRVGDRLGAAGLDVTERTVRPAELPHETTPQAFLVARRGR